LGSMGYCHQAQEVLTFAPQRISKASCTDRPFQVSAGFMDQYLTDSFEGYPSTGQKVKVVLRVAGDAPLYVRDRQWSDNESRRRDDKGNLIIEFHISAVFALAREVRAEAGYVEILEPRELRQHLRKTAQAVVRRHR